ncbi:uncharacterized protein BYT42DRAFT_594446 [Radiomyces spectabilis]|uniref:uncharacterized protein n=1 Tax=Radiomyces spectabilis TaxID=64574 RepID=UPI00221EFEBA|nr:uncharacterized protein BYT42DRAFT_594446 [Radiomyces spectabilis]KAI8374260.1 hypothetical protein BYT42DRAFT_594446 [Radiomyces spectabilis]
MPTRRLRSLSINLPNPNSPTLLSRSFASLRRRRGSSTYPSTPNANDPTTNDPNVDDPNALTNVPTTHTTDSAADVNSTTSVPEVSQRIRLVPSVGLSSRTFVFDVVDRVLHPGSVLKIGRYSERNTLDNRLSFKSKVVSRNHAEMWIEGEKVLIKDIGSSSGTFVNRVRLGPANVMSLPHVVKDGDIIQLGVDYQGGLEPMYRAVRIKVELNREEQTQTNHFSRAAFQQLRHHLLTAVAPPTTHQQHMASSLEAPSTSIPHLDDHAKKPISIQKGEPINNATLAVPTKKITTELARHGSPITEADIQECCICLYAIAPFQALFIAPCSHIFHFKCLRPILFQNYPGFSCPLCRGYADLEESVAVEIHDVIQALGISEKTDTSESASGRLPSIITAPTEAIDMVADGAHSRTSYSSVSDESQPSSSRLHVAPNETIFSSTLVETPMLEEIPRDLQRQSSESS